VWGFLTPVVCGPIIALGISFMTCFNWSRAGCVLVLLGVALLLIRLTYIDIKNKKGVKK